MINNYKCYNDRNKKVLGKFKDEENGHIITEVICLKPKMYAIQTEQSTHKKAKGIPSNNVKKDFDFNNYKSTLDNYIGAKISYASIRSKRQDIFTLNQEKNGLSNYDDKRYWSSNIESLPYGHYCIATNIH